MKLFYPLVQFSSVLCIYFIENNVFLMAGMNLNPQQDGFSIFVPIPKVKSSVSDPDPEPDPDPDQLSRKRIRGSGSASK